MPVHGRIVQWLVVSESWTESTMQGPLDGQKTPMDWIDKPRLHYSPHPGIWESGISSLPRLSRWLRVTPLGVGFSANSQIKKLDVFIRVSTQRVQPWETIKASRADPSTFWHFDRILFNMAFLPLHVSYTHSMQVISTFPHSGYERAGEIFRCKGASWLSEG